MTGDISFYLSAVAITMVITGVLAWIAWQHPPLPGVRAFALMGLDVFLMAMTEILSMVSRQQEQALFWFNISQFFISFISVLFLLFAVRYYGHGTWLSRWVLAALFVVPVITQVVIWIPALHPLWATKDIIFVHVGAFWVSLDTTHIPGAWYVVDGIYSLLLLVVAAIVILLAAWNKRGTLLRQSLLLSAGAVLGLALALVAFFDPFPNLNFKILIPGLGVISLLFGLAVFRFRLLGASAVSEDFSEVDKFKYRERRSLAFILIVYVAAIAGIITIGYFSYNSFSIQLQQQVEYQLDSIAKLKIDGLTDWRNERQGDAEAISHNPAFPLSVEGYLNNPDGLNDPQVIQSWLDTLKKSYSYDRIMFLDVEGTVRFSSPKGDVPVTPHLLEHVEEALISGEVTWTDFHRHDDLSIHLTLIAPVFAGQNLNRPLGTVIFEIDPNTWLYPYLQFWPTESQTAETLLVRQEGDEVVFLNPTRFDPDAALNLRLPSSQSQVNAVKAILGSRGIVEGLDYRGQPVVSAIYAVSDTPWILIARMDKAEIFAPARIRLVQTAAFIGILILALGGGLGLFWRGNRMREYRNKLIAAEALRESEEKFRNAFALSPDAVSITNIADGKLISVNDGFTKILGYSAEEVIGMNANDLDIWEDESDKQKLATDLVGKGSVQGFEARFHTKSGEKRYGLTAAAVIQINGIPHILSTTRDITARKEAENAVRDYSSHLEEMVEERTRELTKAQERLLRQERLAALGQLAGSIAHELRNPLGVISNATAYLSMIQPEADEKVREYIKIIQSETHTSEKIIADLMDYARLQTVERKPANISGIIRNAQRRNPAPGNVKVSTDIIADLPLVLVNATQIEQVIGNLLTNAYQAMPTAGKLFIKAELSGDPNEEEWIKITVRDSGEGITPEDMERIFEPLFTTKAKGIGLGLAVSKKIIDANHGRIEVESQPGKGSTFTLHLPIQKETK